MPISDGSSQTGSIKHVDPMTRSVRVRFVFSNPGVVLKPRRYVTPSMHLSHSNWSFRVRVFPSYNSTKLHSWIRVREIASTRGRNWTRAVRAEDRTQARCLSFVLIKFVASPSPTYYTPSRKTRRRALGHSGEAEPGLSLLSIALILDELSRNQGQRDDTFVPV